jgi:UPF0755 protein
MLMYYLFRFSGQSRLIRAGSYEIANTTNAWDLLQKLVRGEENLKAITLVEGWNLRQWRQALAKAEFLKHDTQGDTDAELMRRFDRGGNRRQRHRVGNREGDWVTKE